MEDNLFTTSMIIGLGTTAAFLVTVGGTITPRGIAKHANKVDVFGTLLIYFMFAGTSTMGILVAMWAGLFIGLSTRIMKRFYPSLKHEKESFKVPQPTIKIKLER